MSIPSARTTEWLARLGYAGPLMASADTLRRLHVAHLTAVPFENLDIHIGRPIVLDEDAFFRKIVARRRGGFCYELNGLFAAMLRELGYSLTLLSAGVAREGGGFGPDFDHLTLLVDTGERWLADVGFGDGFREPLRFDDFGPQGEFRLEPENGSRVLLWNGKPQYRLTLAPRRLDEFAGMCHYHQTSPLTTFTQGRVCTIATPSGRITLTDNRLIVTDGGKRTEMPVESEEAFQRVLRERFGIDLP